MSNTVPQDDNMLFRSGYEVADAVADYGTKIGRMITTKDYLPHGDKQFAIRLGAEPPGTRVILGSLRGVVNTTEHTVTIYNGKELPSIRLHGEFEAVMRGTGELKSAPTAILPVAFGLTIENALKGLEPDEKVELTIDCDVGLEATGRNIPYEWVVIYYRDGVAHKAQRAMRNVRARSEARLAAQSQKLISSPPASA